jgi:type II secretory pathway pseudopilin PulG
MAKLILQSAPTPGSSKQSNGFILLEVLVAMSLVTSSWMALGNTYQQMVLRLGQLQEQRVQMKQSLDQHELALLATAQSKNFSHQSRKSSHEPTGMSRRSRPISHIGRTPYQK